MTTQFFEPHSARLFRYAIASADMYYAELEQRDVFLGNDKYGNLAIWGEIADRGPSTKIELCEIFLEYGLYCCSWCNMGEALYHMQDFGERIGRSLANYLVDNPSLLVPENSAIYALEHIFESMGACFSAEYSQTETRLMITDCPLEKTAERSGLRNIELAHHGINAMCQSLVHSMNSNLNLTVSSSDQPEFSFTIMMPVPA